MKRAIKLNSSLLTFSRSVHFVLLAGIVGSCDKDPENEDSGSSTKSSSAEESTTGPTGKEDDDSGSEDGETGSGEESDATADTGDDEYRPCPVESQVGQFRIDLADQFTGVGGAVTDGVNPQMIPETVDGGEECKFQRPRTLFCDPPCILPEVCGDEGTCVPAPINQGVGTVEVTGFKVPLSMEPNGNNSYLNPPGLPHPGFETGASITLKAAGDTYPSFSLQGWGIEPFKTKVEKPVVEEGKPLELSWEPPTEELPTRIRINLNVNNHGTSSGWINCVVPDTGSFSVPEDLISKLIDNGVSGFPSIILSRQTADSVEIGPGCVQMLVKSEIGLSVEIPGLVSCVEDSDCPEGQTCQDDLTCG